jgi:catechol 2,3-dioxygenase-like lactoylglutathione lyase family enzyme
VAISALNLRRTQAWYRSVIGLAPAGGANLAAGPLVSRVQGLPRAASTVWWMIDGQDHFHFELFEFRRPPVRPLPADWRPCDIGYTMMSIHVDDLDGTLAPAVAAGTPPLTPPIGDSGARRACVRDPDGIPIELMDDDPRAAVRRDSPRVVTRAATLSVPDLGRSRRAFGETLELDPADDVELHRAEHEGL